MRTRSALISVATAVALAVPTAAIASTPPTDTADDTADETTEASIAAARAGLADYVDANKPSAPTVPRHLPDCPLTELDRLDEALADALAAGGLGDPRDDPAGDGERGWGLAGWGATVDQSEYRDLGPDLTGVTCAADVDGDTSDLDRELAVEVTAIDLGDDARYPAYLNHVAFGVLDYHEADVPGGSLDSSCVLAEYGSLCLSLWQHDGFVVQLLVASTVVELPAGTSAAMIGDLLDDVLASLAAQIGATPVTEPDGAGAGGADDDLEGTDAARAGLDRLLATTFDTRPLEPLAACVVLDAAALNRALQTAGNEVTISPFQQEVGPLPHTETRAVTCTGDSVGMYEPSFPETTVILTVADLGSTAAVADWLDDTYPESASAEVLDVPRSAEIDGETIGFCASVDRTERCRVFWADDGFLVGVDIADRVYVDHITTATVLVAIVPTVVENLGAG